MSKGPHLDDLLKMGEAQAHRVLIGGKEELVPMFHLVYPDGTSAVIGTPWHNDAEKDAAVAAVRTAMHAGDVIRYSFICEAWTIRLNPGEPMPDTRPSESPNRVEMVRVSACDLKRQKLIGFEIKRDKNGNCVDLVKQDYETVSVSGTMSELLK